MNAKNKIFLGITVIITVLLITIGVSYAYFTANLSGGEDSTTITVTGGTMNIIYNGGANINISNIIPDDNPAATKNFTVTGNNTTDVEMMYQINFIIESNTFSEEALKYKLISTNMDSNGIVVPSVTNLTNIGTGAKTIKLGVGEFTAPTSGNKVHTYILEIYFSNADYNQNIDQGKEINAYINTDKYTPPPLLKDKILAQGGGIEVITAKSNPDFSKVSTSLNTGLYATNDEYGTSYYYRGLKTELNNNLIWGGFQWKIIRINGDSSIRLIYNGTEAQFNTNAVINDIGVNTQISGTQAWNVTNHNDAKYVGYMYGGSNGVASTVRNGTTSTSATYNQTSTNIKTVLENWYQVNILGKPFENQVVDNLFCNDRQIQTGTGYGMSETIYAAYQRLYTAKTPTLKCVQKNDRFTKNDKTIGNGSLTYPIGLITADEASMAGLLYGTNNLTNYLNTNQVFWTMTPHKMYSQGSAYAEMFNIFSSANFSGSHVRENPRGVRPVISLDSQIEVIGEGTATNPFIAQIKK